MDESRRRFTKISREAQRFTRIILKDTGLGLTEHEFIHTVNKIPGISQDGVSKRLAKDKAAVARMAKNLEKKGYIVRRRNEKDKRENQLFVTEKAKEVKETASRCESFFYEWIMSDIDSEEKKAFLNTLDKIYWKSKNERRNGFSDVVKLWGEKDEGWRD